MHNYIIDLRYMLEVSTSMRSAFVWAMADLRGRTRQTRWVKAQMSVVGALMIIKGCKNVWCIVCQNAERFKDWFWEWLVYFKINGFSNTVQCYRRRQSTQRAERAAWVRQNLYNSSSPGELYSIKLIKVLDFVYRTTQYVSSIIM